MISPDRRREIQARAQARKDFDPQKEARLRLFANQNIPGATYGFANVPLMDSINANQFDAKSLPYQDVLDGVNLKGIGLKNFSIHDGNIVDKVFDARLKALNNDKSAGELAVIRHMKDWGLTNNQGLVTFLETGILQPGVTKDTLLEAYDYGLRQDAKHMQTKSPGFFKSLFKGNIGAIAGALVGGLPGAAFGASVQRGVEGDTNPFSAFMSPEGQIFYDVAMSGKKGLEKGKGSTDPSFLSNVGSPTNITAPKGSALYNAQIAANQSSAGATNLAMPTRREYKQPTYAINTLTNNLGNNSMQLANFSLQPDPVIDDLNVLFPDPYYLRGTTSTPEDLLGLSPELKNISRLFGEEIARRVLYQGEKTNPYITAGGTPGSAAEAYAFNNRPEMNLMDLVNPFLAALTPQQAQSLNLPQIGGSYNYRFAPVQFGNNPPGVQSQIAEQSSEGLSQNSFDLQDIIRQIQRG